MLRRIICGCLLAILLGPAAYAGNGGRTLPQEILKAPLGVTPLGAGDFVPVVQDSGLVKIPGDAFGSGGGGLPTLTNGQVLGNATGGTATATATNLVAGSGVTITATGGNLTIGASGSGGVSGPNSSVNGDLACWNGTTGNALSDCGILGSSVVQTSRTISTAAPLAGGGNLSSNLSLSLTVPNANLLGGNGSNFTGITVGSGLSLIGNVLSAGAGSVTSVGLTMPSWFSVSGSPVTSSGTLAVSESNQSPNMGLFSPNGSVGIPVFRNIVNADLPASGVTAGSYTASNITVNAQGIVTAAASGSTTLPMLTNGQVLGNATGSTTTATATNLVAGSGITITATGGNLTIGASGSGGVSGPGSSVNTDLASWNGTGGNALADSGILLANVVQTSRTISTTAPLTGGGNLASNLSLGITIPTANLLGGSAGNFTSITAGTCLSLSGSTLNGTCAGSVTSVGLALPASVFTISGSPVTSTGTLTGSFNNQATNSVFAGPGSGSPAAPGFRALIAADLPSTGVSAGSYTTANITVNAQGQVTAASNGSASTPVIFTGVTAGSANAQTMASPTPSGFAFTNQFIVRFLVGAGLTNTGAATLSVNGTTAEPVEVQSGTALSALTGGELQAGFEYDAVANTSCTCYVLTTIVGTPIINNATSTTISAAQWAHGAQFNVTSGGQTFTLPVATSLSPGGGITINTVGVSATIAPNAADGINGGSVGSSVTVSSGVQASVFTVGSSGTGAFTANPLTNSSISGLTMNTIPKATSSTAIGNSSVTDNGTAVNTTEPIEFGGAKIPTFFLPTASWVAGQNPNNAIIVADLPTAITLFSAAARIEVPVGAAATISLFSAPSGTACSAGTNLASATSINANGTAATNQLLTLTTTSVAAGSSLCLQTTGSGNWTTGSGVGAITIGYNPT